MNTALCLLLPLSLGQAGPGGFASQQGSTHVMNPAVAGYDPASCDTCGPRRSPGPVERLKPPSDTCPPSSPPASLLAVRAVVPEGVLVTASPGDPKAPTVRSGAVFGFRPGYAYRIRMESLPNYPGDTLYAELEVRGSIVPRPGMRYMEYPAPFFITKEDINRALVGGLVTKVIYLEDPSRAVPLESHPDRPIEIPAVGEREAFRDAEKGGRIVAILRLGDRVPAVQELRSLAISGTVLQPGQNRLQSPELPPPLSCSAVPLFDPLLGPKGTPEECLLNGGDRNLPVGSGPGGRVGGREPTELTAEYSTGGKRDLTTSNVVCICSPRFVMQRAEVVPFAYLSHVPTGGMNQYIRNNVFAQRERSIVALAREKSLATEARLRPGATTAEAAPAAIASRSRPQAAYRVDGLRAVASLAEPDELTTIPEGLVITKEVDPSGPAQPGDILTFTIRYRNNGRLPITDLVISDSLSGRLEYVRGSAAADRASSVTTLPNEAGSSTVQIELPGPIQPAARGLVRFQVRVR